MSYLYERYDYSLFESRFKDYGRLDNYTYDGLRAIFNYLEKFAEDLGKPIEVDVIAICCEWNEIDVADIEYETGCETLDELCDETTAIELDNGNVLYLSF